MFNKPFIAEILEKLSSTYVLFFSNEFYFVLVKFLKQFIDNNCNFLWMDLIYSCVYRLESKQLEDIFKCAMELLENDKIDKTKSSTLSFLRLAHIYFNDTHNKCSDNLFVNIFKQINATNDDTDYF